MCNFCRVTHYGRERGRGFGHNTVNCRLADTSLLRTPRYYGHPAHTDTPLIRTPRYYGHPAHTDTPLIRTPR